MAPDEQGARARGLSIGLHGGLATLALVVLAVAVARDSGRASATRQSAKNRPVESNRHGYVSSRQCRSCHAEHYQSWYHSYHRTMTQPATPASVIPSFDGVDLSHEHQHARLSREGDELFAEITFGRLGPLRMQNEERSTRLPIVLVTGSHHMQVYWFETGHGRALGQLPFVYLKHEQRWIPRGHAFVRPPGAPRPSESGRWNNSCVLCHTTHGQPRLQEGEGMDTQVGEFGIACEACHGPGRRHLLEQRSPLTRYSAHLSGEDADDRSIVSPADLDHKRASQICSQCHAIWQFKNAEEERLAFRNGYRYRPGGDPEESLLLFQPSHVEQDTKLARLVERNPQYTSGQFWPDGMARVSGREFNGMIDSGCYQRGELSCMSCHEMHRERDDPRDFASWANDQLAPEMNSDAACTQCHGEIGSDVTAHTHHAAESEGSRCYNCHMPYTSYGLLKAIRSHKITSPNAGVSAETGRPDACNLCHLDKSLGWTAEQLATRYGIAPPRLDGDHDSVALSVLTLLKGDAGQRALIADALGWETALSTGGGPWVAPYLGVLMDDPYAAVRFIAARSLSRLPGWGDFEYDSVPRPRSRAEVAPAIAESAGQQVAATSPPPALLLSSDGKPDDRAHGLLKQRDNRPVDLLE